jgi:hypothetical protein
MWLISKKNYVAAKTLSGKFLYLPITNNQRTSDSTSFAIPS